MNATKTWMFGIAALGLALAAPVQANSDFMDGSFIVAKRDRDDVRQERREIREERRETRREAEREEPRGYGYGYERRQQQRSDNEGRPRDRR